MTSDEQYPYTNLTAALGDKTSPLRRYIDERFPNIKPLQTHYRAVAGSCSLLVDTGGANAGTLGAAFDLVVRFRLDPTLVPSMAIVGFLEAGPASLRAIREVVAVAQDNARSGPAGLEALAKACWALALTTEVLRVGLMPGSPLGPVLAEDRFRRDDLLELAPSDAIRQLRELDELAAANLLARLRSPLHLGPVFDGSSLCSADADLIADGMLLDLKTRLGKKNPRTGARSDGLELRDVYQLVGYTLFDFSDTYKINEIGIYSARYGTLVTWPLEEALHTLAGSEVDLRSERAAIYRVLGGR